MSQSTQKPNNPSATAHVSSLKPPSQSDTNRTTTRALASQTPHTEDTSQPIAPKLSPWAVSGIYVGTKLLSVPPLFPFDTLRSHSQQFPNASLKEIMGQLTSSRAMSGVGVTMLRVGGREAYRALGHNNSNQFYGAVFCAFGDLLLMPLETFKVSKQIGQLSKSQPGNSQPNFPQWLARNFRGGYYMGSFYFFRQMIAYGTTYSLEGARNRLLNTWYGPEDCPTSVSMVTAFASGPIIATVVSPFNCLWNRSVANQTTIKQQAEIILGPNGPGPRALFRGLLPTFPVACASSLAFAMARKITNRLNNS